jgi:ABC-type glycerol-3-phosphate transport system substrate-binding protein
LLFVFGCGQGEKEGKTEIKVAFWGAPDEVNIIGAIIDKWQKSHPDINVKLEHTPYRGYVDKLLTRIAGRSAPDIICTEVDLFVTFQSKGVLLDITPYVEKDTAVKIEDFYPRIIDRFTVGGRLYAIPRDTAPFACIYYNKRLFDEAGIPYPSDSWDVNDLLDAAKKLSVVNPDGRMTRYGFYAWAWQNFVYAFGGRLVDDVKGPTRCALDSEEALRGLRFYADLINKHRVHPSATAMANLAMGVQGMFMTERLAMFSSGIWETPGLRKINNFEWDVAMFPRGPDGIRGFGTGGSGYSILKSTRHPDEAFLVLKALAGRDAQVELSGTGLTQPAIKDIARDWADDGRVPANKKMLLEAMEYVVYDPFTPVWREARALYIDPALDKIFSGKMEAKPAISGIMTKVNRLLNKR